MCLHQDAIAPYISAWCALDDVTLENGALQFIPSTKTHIVDEEEDPDELFKYSSPSILVQKGTVIFFRSDIWHFSASNASSCSRRAFYAQYSQTPITSSPTTNEPLCCSIPCEKVERFITRKIQG